MTAWVISQTPRFKAAMVGAGYMGRGIALQILTAMPGLRLVAIANRDASQAERAYREAIIELRVVPLANPEVDVTTADEGQPLVFTFEVPIA